MRIVHKTVCQKMPGERSGVGLTCVGTCSSFFARGLARPQLISLACCNRYVPKTPTVESVGGNVAARENYCEVDGRATLCVEGIDNQDANLRPHKSVASHGVTMTLAEKLQTYIDAGVADKIKAIKLGDEIALARPSGNSSVNCTTCVTTAATAAEL